MQCKIFFGIFFPSSKFSLKLGLRISPSISTPRWLFCVTEEWLQTLYRENRRRFLRPLFAGCLLTGLQAACSGKSGWVRLRSAFAKAASYPVSRQPAQTSGVKKRFPFFYGSGYTVIESPCSTPSLRDRFYASWKRQGTVCPYKRPSPFRCPSPPSSRMRRDVSY